MNRRTLRMADRQQCANERSQRRADHIHGGGDAQQSPTEQRYRQRYRKLEGADWFLRPAGTPEIDRNHAAIGRK
jgi:hypothetical protein